MRDRTKDAVPSARPRLRLRRRAGGLALAAAALVAGELARAADDIGPPIGRLTYQTTIENQPSGEDTDTYVGVLAAGERLTVKVTSPFNSGLFPELELFGPGSDQPEPVSVVSRRSGRRLEIRSFEIPRGGLWRVRVAARFGSEGLYTITTKVAGPPKQKLGTLRVPAGQTVEVPFQATDGATLDVTLARSRGGAAARIVAILDPSGDEVLTDGGGAALVARARKKSARLKRFPLTGGTGRYTLVLAADDQDALVRTELRVRSPERVRSRRKRRLAFDEPYVEPRSTPRNVAEGMVLSIEGRNLAAAGRPTVLFGGVAGLDVEVDPTGSSMFVTVPAGPEDETVSLRVITGEGQGFELPEHFFYVPTPTFDSIERLDGSGLTGVTTDAGERLRIRGTFFRNGLILRLVPGGDVIPTISSREVLEFDLPAGPAGDLRVKGYDAFLHEPELELVLERKVPPRFAAEPYDPVVVPANTPTLVTVHGRDYDFEDVLRFAGAPVPSLITGPTTRTLQVPSLADGLYDVAFVDRVGTVVEGPSLRVKAPGVVLGVEVVDGAVLGDDGVPLAGGTRARVSGRQFDSRDVVLVGETVAAAVNRASEAFDLLLPPQAAGTVGLTITDAAGQETVFANALRYLGFADGTAARSPAVSAVDDLRSADLVTGDLDGDGREDDVVLVTSVSNPGSRTVRTRLLTGDADGVLVDATDDLPAFGDDAAGLDDWNATAATAADVDGDDDLDLVLVGRSTDPTTVSEVRVFENDGSGAFTVSDLAPATRHTAAVTAEDETAAEHDVFGVRTRRGTATLVLRADFDDDGDDDVLVVRDHFDQRSVHLDPGIVDFTTDPPSVDSDDVAADTVERDDYFTGTRLYEAQATGLVDVSDTALPSAGDSADDRRPCLIGRAATVAFIDDDDLPDLVVTWNDPTTVSSYGRLQGFGIDSRRVASRVLINDGTGEFTDETSTWLPAGGTRGGFEYWHGDVIRAADLDDDGDDDLVIGLAGTVNQYASSTLDFSVSALRILRNDGETTGYVDVTDIALPALEGRGTDNLRGESVEILDVDGDGRLDLIVSTDAILVDGDNRRLRSTRLLFGEDGLTFRDGTGFLVSSVGDTLQGETTAILPELAGADGPVLLLGGDALPAVGPTGRRLRIHVWDE